MPTDRFNPNLNWWQGTLAVVVLVGAGVLLQRYLSGSGGAGDASAPTAHTRTPEKIAEDQAKAAEAKPKVDVAPMAAREPAKLSSKSRAAFCAEFRQLGLKFHMAPLADGKPRDLASDHATMVDAVGHGDALESASLTFSGPHDAVAVFMRATGWSSGVEWVTTAMAKSDASLTVKNGVRYQLTPLAGMFTLSAEDAP